ncbi:lipase 3-like [Ostrinia nubilalis]|uniref:lipase 3-like n=1 Tax=Ostrinia nubilalis TaxID=29057 RepID=UPI0030822ECD
MEVTNCVVVLYLLLLVLPENHVGTSKLTPATRPLSYALPEARELKMALGYAEEIYLNFTELTTKNGYQTEEHKITTDDGYILKCFRILPKCTGNLKRYPILLMHGILDTSDVWILAGEKLGLGYILASNCYDVWAVNSRGNRYSRKHITLDPDKDIAFWNYSFDEIGMFDVPAAIDYILKVTNRPRVFYAGHSQGTTDFFAMASLRPEYNQKVQLSLQLAPVAWMTNIYSPILRALAQNVDFLKEVLDAVGLVELLAMHQLEHLVLEVLCQAAPEPTCGAALALSTGYEQGTIDSKVLSISFGHLLSGSSSKSLAHYGQLILSRKFKRFDEGKDGNLKRYKQTQPPEYNVSNITSPVVLISGKNDWLSSLKDVATLSSKLPNLVENYVVPEPKWSHHNHIWDVRSLKYVVPKILDYLEQYNT